MRSDETFKSDGSIAFVICSRMHLVAPLILDTQTHIIHLKFQTSMYAYVYDEYV